jgi:hypothetical protein
LATGFVLLMWKYDDFSKDTEFQGFFEEFMNLRQQAIFAKNKGLENFYNMCFNASIEQEIMNEENHQGCIM